MQCESKFYYKSIERVVTLSGSRESVNHAKELLSQMCSQQNCGSIETVSCVIVPPTGTGGYPPYQEVMVPGSKVGLVIGKGGETIKMLQEKTGAKMVIIQEGPAQECVVSVWFGLFVRRFFRFDFQLFPTMCRRSHYEFLAIRRKLNMPNS